MTDLQAVSHPFLDLENPQHFVNLVPEALRNAILKIPHEYFEWTETRLITKLYGEEPPADIDFELRLNFWEEYERCADKCIQMNFKKITDGICSVQHFRDQLLHNHMRLMFIITQPAKLKTRMKYAYHLSMLEMIKVLKAREQINTKTGLTDTKLMEIKFRIFEYLDQRIHGTLIQRIEQKSLNVNVNSTKEELTESPQTAEEIDLRIKQLEGELNFLPKQSQNILSPLEKTIIEDGKVVDAEFKRDR